MLERTDAITNEVLEPITFVLTYPSVTLNCISVRLECGVFTVRGGMNL